jgi:uncharacterized MAPEG superfamily protein
MNEWMNKVKKANAFLEKNTKKAHMNFLNCFLSFGASAILCVLLGRNVTMLKSSRQII